MSFTYSKDGSYIQGATFTLTPPNVADVYTDATTYDIQAGFGVYATASATTGAASGLIASNQSGNVNLCTVGAAVSGAFPVSCDFTAGTNTGGIPVGDTVPAVVGASETNALGGVNTGADQFNVLVTTIAPTS